MSTDSSELTFVRCPSCRSLVPAVSTRCRMCGASLEASARHMDEGGDTVKPSSRVRQRTASTDSSTEFAEVRDRLREEVAQPTVNEPEELEEEAAFDDPLSAYVQEMEVAEEEPTSAPASAEPQADESVLDEAPAVESKESSGRRAEEEEIEPVPAINPFARDFKEPGKDNGAAKAAAADADEDFEPKVRVESGLHKRNKKMGLFGKKPRREEEDESYEETPAVEDVPVPLEPPKAAAKEVKVERHEEKREERPERREERREERQEKREERRPAQSADSYKAPAGRFDTPPDLEAAPRQQFKGGVVEPVAAVKERQSPAVPDEASRREGGAKRVQTEKELLGRLFGWLVSYSNSEGEAVELREGKFFVSSGGLKENDLIIKDESVSTPHAMVSITLDKGLQVQDLLSERGVFVRRQGMDTYRREEGTINIKNGDWVRFGDVEFLVALIPFVGIK